jgi:hypothetical protein
MIDYSKKHNSTDFPSNMLGYNAPFQTIQHDFTLPEIYPAISDQFEIKDQDIRLVLNRYKHENKLLKAQLKNRSFLQTLIRYKKKLIG